MKHAFSRNMSVMMFVSQPLRHTLKSMRSSKHQVTRCRDELSGRKRVGSGGGCVVDADEGGNPYLSKYRRLAVMCGMFKSIQRRRRSTITCRQSAGRPLRRLTIRARPCMCGIANDMAAEEGFVRCHFGNAGNQLVRSATAFLCRWAIDFADG